MSIQVRGRVIVDCFAYHHFQQRVRPYLKRFKRSARSEPPHLPASPPIPPMPPRMPPPGPPGHPYPPQPMMSLPPLGPLENPGPPPPGGWVMLDHGSGPKPQLSIDRGEEVEELTEEQLMLCAPEVRGFELKNKKWSKKPLSKLKTYHIRLTRIQ